MIHKWVELEAKTDPISSRRSKMDQLEKLPTMEIIEMCKISPCPSTVAVPEKFSLPLTLFDVMQFVAPPIKRIFFYSLPLDESQLASTILQNLKQSLSTALSHFLPFAGNLVWPEHSSEPFILYNSGDSVSLTISKTHADFNYLSTNHVRQANESHFLVPDLQSLDSTVAPIMSAQITLFPNCGLSIGIIINHQVADGKTASQFLKSWASICRNNNLPPNLIPNFDRTVVGGTKFKNENKLYQNLFNGLVSNNTKTFSFPTEELIADDFVRGTFEVTRADMEKLRRKVGSSRHFLTNFVVTYSYITSCLAKAQPMEASSKTGFSFCVDWRGRMGNDFGGLNYFGNGVFGSGICLEEEEFEEDENVMRLISSKISDRISEIEMKIKEGKFVEMMEENLGRWISEMPISLIINAAESPKFGLYDIDFGWGRCHKVEIVSSLFSTSLQSFTMVDSRNGNGGVEVGVVLPTKTMNTFCSLFHEGLKNNVD